MSTSTKMSIEKVARALVYLVYFWVMLSIVILVLGFFLLLFGANPDASFAEWTYRALDRVMKPFRGLFESLAALISDVLTSAWLASTARRPERQLGARSLRGLRDDRVLRHSVASRH